MHPLDFAVEIAGSEVPMLTLAAIHRQFDAVAVGSMECLIPMQHGLNVVIARLKLGQAANRITESRSVDGDGFVGAQRVHIQAKNQLRFKRIVDLQARLGRGGTLERRISRFYQRPAAPSSQAKACPRRSPTLRSHSPILDRMCRPALIRSHWDGTHT